MSRQLPDYGPLRPGARLEIDDRIAERDSVPRLNLTCFVREQYRPQVLALTICHGWAPSLDSACRASFGSGLHRIGFVYKVLRLDRSCNASSAPAPDIFLVLISLTSNYHNIKIDSQIIQGIHEKQSLLADLTGYVLKCPRGARRERDIPSKAAIIGRVQCSVPITTSMATYILDSLVEVEHPSRENFSDLGECGLIVLDEGHRAIGIIIAGGVGTTYLLFLYDVLKEKRLSLFYGKQMRIAAHERQTVYSEIDNVNLSIEGHFQTQVYSG
jgi:hypothetical protein